MADNVARFGWVNPTANGNIRPSRVVVGVTGAGNAKKVVEASTAGTVPPVGITREDVRRPGGIQTDDGYHAIATEPCSILGPGDIGYAVAGAAITDARQPLTWDNQGRVVTAAPAAGAAVWCIAWPLQTVAAAGEKVEVAVVPPFKFTEPV